MTSQSDLPPPTDDEARAPAPAALAAPVSVRNPWLVLLTVFAGLYFLHWASPVLMPVMLGILISCALAPVVNAMQAAPTDTPLLTEASLLDLEKVTVPTEFLRTDARRAATLFPQNANVAATIALGIYPRLLFEVAEASARTLGVVGSLNALR